MCMRQTFLFSSLFRLSSNTDILIVVHFMSYYLSSRLSRRLNITQGLCTSSVERVSVFFGVHRIVVPCKLVWCQMGKELGWVKSWVG